MVYASVSPAFMRGGRSMHILGQPWLHSETLTEQNQTLFFCNNGVYFQNNHLSEWWHRAAPSSSHELSETHLFPGSTETLSVWQEPAHPSVGLIPEVSAADHSSFCYLRRNLGPQTSLHVLIITKSLKMNNFLEIAILASAKPSRSPAFTEKEESVNTMCLSCEQPGQLTLQCQGFAIPVSDMRHQQPGKNWRGWQRPCSFLTAWQMSVTLQNTKTYILWLPSSLKFRNRREKLVQALPLPFLCRNMYFRKHSNIFNTQIMVFRIILKDIFQIS